MFMMTTVLERLHTTKCSGFLGSRMTLLTVMSVPADVPRGLKVLLHSVVFTFHTWPRGKKKEVSVEKLEREKVKKKQTKKQNTQDLWMV